MVNQFFRRFSWLYCKLFHPVTVSGKENLPTDAPFLMAVNHQSARDPIILASFMSWDTTAMAKKELFDFWLTGWIMRGVNAIPVERESGDMNSMRECLKHLKAGHPLVIFPEGHRFHDGRLHEIKTGTAFIALRANVPLIPARIHTSYRPFAKVEVNIGAPIAPSALSGSEALNDVTKRLTEALEAL
ncbi:MAG: 1-acyl-sn-glycerol-3-phosphate acyltransferase [Clostridia bacterium]|nr:1-acyl-sn-glycerol-3-phosphate acyltransferase [Clostridia bacterium]